MECWKPARVCLQSPEPCSWRPATIRIWPIEYCTYIVVAVDCYRYLCTYLQCMHACMHVCSISASCRMLLWVQHNSSWGWTALTCALPYITSFPCCTRSASWSYYFISIHTVTLHTHCFCPSLPRTPFYIPPLCWVRSCWEALQQTWCWIQRQKHPISPTKKRQQSHSMTMDKL